MILYCVNCGHLFDTDETCTADRDGNMSETCDPCFDRIRDMSEALVAAIEAAAIAPPHPGREEKQT